MPKSRRATETVATPRKRSRKRTISTTTSQNKQLVVDDTRTEDAGTLDCEHPATVSVGAKVTRNLGDYNSLQVSLHISMPCRPDDASLNVCYRETSDKVQKLLEEEFQRAHAAQGTP